jgi:hypothetical protein
MRSFLSGLGVLAAAGLLLVLAMLSWPPFRFEDSGGAEVEPGQRSPLPRAAEPVHLQPPEPDPAPVTAPVAADTAREDQAPPPLGGLEDGHVPPGVHPPKKKDP